MKEKQRIVLLAAQGWSISAIAEELQIDRKTVRRYVRQENFSETFPQTPDRASQLDPFKPTIQAWLAEDGRVRYKQRHTAERVHQRLQEEFPDAYTGSYSGVQRYMKRLRLERHASVTGTLELVWEPGTAQVDFGTADVYWHDRETTPQAIKYLVVSFPFSNAAVVQYFPGETAECVTQGLRDIFQRLGGVPPRIVFDNATGVGRRAGEVIRYANLFERFQAHYGFETTFCNVAAGYEKGNVEANVGMYRRTLMVPPPVLNDWTTANHEAFGQCAALWHRLHYKKGLPIATLFETDRQALCALPAQPFEAVRFTRVQTDGYGKFRLDTHHWYSSAPEWARQELVVQIGAFTVVPYTSEGTPITTHPRQYGDTRTDTVDPRTTLQRLSRNPGAFRNSSLRAILPPDLVATLDQYVRDDLRECLRALADVSERYSFDHAQRALEEAVRSQHTAYADIIVRATRMGYWTPEDLDSPVDLTRYDDLLPQGVLQ